MLEPHARKLPLAPIWPAAAGPCPDVPRCRATIARARQAWRVTPQSGASPSDAPGANEDPVSDAARGKEHNAPLQQVAAATPGLRAYSPQLRWPNGRMENGRRAPRQTPRGGGPVRRGPRPLANEAPRRTLSLAVTLTPMAARAASARKPRALSRNKNGVGLRPPRSSRAGGNEGRRAPPRERPWSPAEGGAGRPRNSRAPRAAGAATAARGARVHAQASRAEATPSANAESPALRMRARARSSWRRGATLLTRDERARRSQSNNGRQRA